MTQDQRHRLLLQFVALAAVVGSLAAFGYAMEHRPSRSHRFVPPPSGQVLVKPSVQ